MAAGARRAMMRGSKRLGEMLRECRWARISATALRGIVLPSELPRIAADERGWNAMARARDLWPARAPRITSNGALASANRSLTVHAAFQAFHGGAWGCWVVVNGARGRLERAGTSECSLSGTTGCACGHRTIAKADSSCHGGVLAVRFSAQFLGNRISLFRLGLQQPRRCFARLRWGNEIEEFAL